MSAHRRRAGSGFLLLVVLLSALAGSLLGAKTSSGATIFATTAADICDPLAAQCLITDDVRVTDGATLDFGVRRVELVGDAKLSAGSNGMTILCESFVASGNSAFGGLVAKGSEDGFVTGGWIKLQASQGCSGADAFCMNGWDCSAGTCGVRRCAARKTRLCQADSDCDMGTCAATHRCSANSVVRCTSDAQCQMGPCSEQITCSRIQSGQAWPDGVVACASNADCDFGTCTRGSGTIDLNAAVNVDGDSAGSVILVGQGDVAVRRAIDASSSAIYEVGGDVKITSHHGGVSVLGDITMQGEGGGSATISADGRIEVRGTIDVRGGESSGGTIDFTSDGDVLIQGRLLASAMTMAGNGGEIYLDARGDLQFDGSTLGATSQVSIHGADGPEWTEGGYAGSLWAYADRDILVTGFSRISAYGALPYGGGGEIDMLAKRDLYFAGVIDAVGAPVLGVGGSVSLDATRKAEFAAGSKIDLTGGEADGQGGAFWLAAGQEAVIDGAVKNRGGYFKNDSDVEVSACSVHVGPNADLDLRALGADNRLAGGDSLVIDAGARLSSAFGVNELLYRDAAYPPMVAGWLSPAATLTAKPSLPTCRCAGLPSGEQGECDAVCGDAILASTESCDDGNAVSGDGCDSNCSVTACGNSIITSGEQCDDGNNAQGDGCDSACQLDCPPTPSPTCHAPTRAGASILRAADAAGTARDSIKWRLRGADSTTLASFGDPLASTGYVLCLYGSADAVSSSVLQETVPSAAECGAPGCWQRRGLSGYRYRGAASGRVEVSLSARAGGLGDIAVTTKGAAAFVPALPLPQDPSVTVHLRSSQGQCWGATFSAPAARNNALLFKDSSD